jgi:hypothetical protein
MTADEWLTSSKPDRMLAAVAATASGRKLRLIACALCRLVWDHISDPDYRATIAAAEGYADGLHDGSEFREWNDHIQEPGWGAAHLGPAFMAATAVRGATLENPAAGVILAAQWCEVLAVSATGTHRRTQAAFRSAAADVIREIIGPLSHPLVLMAGPMLRDYGGPAAAFRARVTGTARGIAEAVYADGAFDKLPILADALEDAGLDDRPVLDHLRHGTGHVRGCWALDFVLGKA